MEDNFSVFKLIALGHGYDWEEELELYSEDMDQETLKYLEDIQNPKSYFGDDK